MKNTDKLSKYLNQLESHIPKFEEKDSKVSLATVGWQIDHSLRVINSVCKSLQNSDPKSYKNNFTLLGKVFLVLGFYPRGKAKAPKYVMPPENILKDDLVAQTNLARKNIETLVSLDHNAYFKHPLFGNVNKKRVYRFLETHTKHHLKIINDILK